MVTAHERVCALIFDECEHIYHGNRGHFAGICPRCMKDVIQAAEQAMKERRAAFVEAWVKHYPVDIFTVPPQGEHGKTVDGCSAHALRVMLPIIAAKVREIGEEEDDESEETCANCNTAHPEGAGCPG